MTDASQLALPRSNSSQVFNSMPGIVVPNGYTLSIPFGQFTQLPFGWDDGPVQTIDQTRLARLQMLIAERGGVLANLNEALGFERNHTQLARIRNANARKDRPGKVYSMGDQQAREIETKLGLPTGWMDTPPTLVEQYGEDDVRSKFLTLAVNMPESDLLTAYTILNALNKAKVDAPEPEAFDIALPAPRAQRRRMHIEPFLPQAGVRSNQKKTA